MALTRKSLLHALIAFLLSVVALAINHDTDDKDELDSENEQKADFFHFEHLLIHHLHFGKAPPFYFVWGTSIIKLVISLVVFGPPKAGTQKDITTLSQKASLVAKRCIQSMVALLCLFTFVSDIVKAVRLGAVLWEPPEIAGVSTGMSDMGLDKLVRFLGGVGVVFSSSSVISSIATVSALKGLYDGHYIMDFCHEGDRVASDKMDKGELAQCKRHGKKNLLEAAGHQDASSETMVHMQEKEGFVLKNYMKLIDILLLVYLVMSAFWVVIGIMLYVWLFLLCMMISMAVAQQCAQWTIGREEKKQSAGSSAGQPGYVVQLQELESPEGIYYFMLEYKKSTDVVLTKDVEPDEIYKDATGSEVEPITGPGQWTDETFRKDCKFTVRDMTYEVLYRDPEDPSKRIQIVWAVKEKSGKDTRSTIREGWIALDSVKPTYTQEEAEQEYAAKLKSYHFTGTTDEAWTNYYLYPLTASLVCTIFGTLGMRYVIGMYAWPHVEDGEYVSKVSWGEIWSIYKACLRMLTERTIVGYFESLKHTLLHSAVQALNLLNLFF